MQPRSNSEAPPDIANVLRQDLLDPNFQRTLALGEVQHASEIFFGSPELLALYGMPPAVYYARGLRIASRTVVECALDGCAIGIVEAVLHVVRAHFAPAPIAVLDLFAGSGNLMFHAKRILSASLVIGFERDDLVYRLTRMNFELVGLDAALYHGDCEALLDERHVPPEHLCIALIAPPWGNAFDFIHGLDLRRTEPPIGIVLELLRGRLRCREVLCVLQTHEILEEPSVVMVTAGRRVYARGTTQGLPSGRNIGYIICTL